MKNVVIESIVIVILVTLMCPLPVYPASHPLDHPPWDIEAVPDTVYIRPPTCVAYFWILVTDYYKTKPIKIYIERSKATVMGLEFSFPSQLQSEPPYEELWKGKMPDWQALVTLMPVDPWVVPAGDYPLTIWAYPADLSQADGTAYNVFTVVHMIVENTGVEKCGSPPPPPPPPPRLTTTTIRYTSHWTSTYDWWNWWRWDWWVEWWPWTTGEFDFSLDATPASQSMKAGQTGSFTTDVKLVSGAAQPVTLTLSGPPAGVSYSFSLPSADPSFTSALQVTSQASLSPGTYPLTVVGTGGGKTHSTIVNLVVAENKQSSSLSLSVSPPSLEVGESVALGGALSPGLATTVELVYTRPDGFELVKHVTTSGAGAFSDAFKPDMPGPWSVKARWPGDADHYAGESQTQSFSVEPPPEQPPSLWDQIARILPTVALLAVLLVVAVLVVVLLRRRSAHRPHGPTAVKARFCTKCGTTIPEGSGYCPNCGERI
jgi:hypothetical protein